MGRRRPPTSRSLHPVTETVTRPAALWNPGNSHLGLETAGGFANARMESTLKSAVYPNNRHYGPPTNVHLRP